MTNPRVFISYAHTDIEFTQRLCSELEALGVEVWVDEKEIRVGDSISEQIEHGLGWCQYFCLVLSENSMSRPWVQREYRAALNMQLSQGGEGTRILPLKTTELPLPPLLQDIRFADFAVGFSAGLSQLSQAMRLPETIAPFAEIVSTIGVAPDDLSSTFAEALERQDMNILTAIWQAIEKGAHVLNRELPAEKTELVSFDKVDPFLKRSSNNVGILLLPAITMKEHINGHQNREYGFAYTVSMEGVVELITCLGRWFDAVRSRRIYLAPRSISWNSGWPESEEHIVLKTKITPSYGRESSGC